MEPLLARYYELKEKQKQVEQELEKLRIRILESFAEAGQAREGEYRLTISYQERRNYHDDKLFNALPDPALWRLMSRADPGKISSLLKLKIIQEPLLEGTYELKKVPILRVEKE
jgi:hypothetical protein